MHNVQEMVQKCWWPECSQNKNAWNGELKLHSFPKVTQMGSEDNKKKGVCVCAERM